jgi:SAM-dependent methyltransferase
MNSTYSSRRDKSPGPAAHRKPQTPLSSGICLACGSRRPEALITAPDRFFARATEYHLLRCSECGLAWLADPPSTEELPSHYGPSYDAFIRRAKSTDPTRQWKSAVDTLFLYKSGGSLLDVGCGSGSFLKTVPPGMWHRNGLEMSAECAKEAREGLEGDVLAEDIIGAKFPAESYDAITCFHVLEHLYAPKLVLANFHRWLKPGGILCLRVPNIDASEAKVFRSFWYPLELPRHLFHFSPNSLNRLASAVGFRREFVRTYRMSFCEYSFAYALDAMLKKIGISRCPLAHREPPSLSWRIVRKLFRISVLPVISYAMAATGGGQVIDAVFRKPEAAQ